MPRSTKTYSGHVFLERGIYCYSNLDLHGFGHWDLVFSKSVQGEGLSYKLRMRITGKTFSAMKNSTTTITICLVSYFQQSHPVLL